MRPPVCDRASRPSSSTALDPREQLNLAFELRIAACGIAWIECDLDRRRHADTFEAFAIHAHIVDREQQQALVADQERSGREHSAFSPGSDQLTKLVFLEPIGEHLL